MKRGDLAGGDGRDPHDRLIVIKQMRYRDRRCKRAAWWGKHGGNWPPLNWPRYERQRQDLWLSWRGGVYEARHEWWYRRWLQVKRLAQRALR